MDLKLSSVIAVERTDGKVSTQLTPFLQALEGLAGSFNSLVPVQTPVNEEDRDRLQLPPEVTHTTKYEPSQLKVSFPGVTMIFYTSNSTLHMVIEGNLVKFEQLDAFGQAQSFVRVLPASEPKDSFDYELLMRIGLMIYRDEAAAREALKIAAGFLKAYKAN